MSVQIRTKSKQSDWYGMHFLLYLKKESSKSNWYHGHIFSMAIPCIARPEDFKYYGPEDGEIFLLERYWAPKIGLDLEPESVVTARKALQVILREKLDQSLLKCPWLDTQGCPHRHSIYYQLQRRRDGNGERYRATDQERQVLNDYDAWYDACEGKQVDLEEKAARRAKNEKEYGARYVE